jgi:L-amino acid N-acyltransferase YncA
MREQIRAAVEGGLIRDLRQADIADLVPIIRYWVRREGQVIETEVRKIVEMLQADFVNSYGIYLVAEGSGGRAAGVMGCAEVNSRMASFQSSPDAKASGLRIAFISPECRGKGVGKILLTNLFERARQEGWTEMIWSSNPRYRDTAWLFYTGIAGEPVGMIRDFFEPGSQSPVWRKRW